MEKPDLVRLEHMLAAAIDAVSFAAGPSRDDLTNNRMLVLSLVKSIEIIGEAANRVSEQTRHSVDALPWADIIGMRNRLIHVYYDVNLDILWQTVVEDLPPLVAEIERTLSGERGSTA